jgi:pyruvate dehydrogenase E1 component beta subunit
VDRELTYPQALNEALAEEMRKDNSLLVLGQDIGVLGGVWGMTKGLLEEFGPDRIIESPISEATMVGMGIGASLNNIKLIVDIQRVDFLLLAMSMITNEAAKIHYLTDGRAKVQLIIHTLTGALGIAGAQHSQSLESMFCHIPGIKVVIPSSGYEAKGLMKSAIHDQNPIIFCDHVKLNLTKSKIPEEEYFLPINKARHINCGDDLTIVSNGYTSFLLNEMLPELQEKKINADIIDLRSIKPIDFETIDQSVIKTGKLMVVHEPNLIGGFGTQIVAHVVEKYFNVFKKPPICLGSLDCSIPHNPNLAKEVLVTKGKIFEKIDFLMER